jgi:PhzF family phenazine biosynthesis protein
MNIPIFQVDAFTDTPFKGNPAGVCLLPEWHSDLWMQNVAQEMNLSETAFLVREGEGHRLRWFTPSIEVELCGHATLASSHILWEQGIIPKTGPALFQTLSGPLSAKLQADGIELNFPATPAQACPAPPDLEQALGARAVYIGQNRFDYIALLENEQELRNLHPNFDLLRKLSVRGVIVTAHSSEAEFDFVSRFFAPGAGIDEDPVTGSAHCCLGPFWQARLGRDTFRAFQASARGGIVRVSVRGDRVLLGGRAVTVLRGELLALHFPAVPISP